MIKKLKVAIALIILLLLAISCKELSIKTKKGKSSRSTKTSEAINRKDEYYYAPHIEKLGFKETSPPAYKVREYHLPGSLIMKSWSQSCVVFYRKTFSPYPQFEVWLFDRKTEKFYPVIRKPVNFKRKFEVLGLTCSNYWIAWEEVAPGDDLVVPVDWCLYAAPVDLKAKKIGKPLLLDKGNTQVKHRPLMGFMGEDVLVWMINYRPPSKRFGAIVSQNLKTGEKRILAKSKLNFGDVSTSEHFALATEYKGLKSFSSSLHLIDVFTGKDRIVDLKNIAEICHFPKYHDGVLAISLFEVRDRPDLFIKFLDKGNKKPYLVSLGGLDPCFVGHYLFFIREINKPIGTGVANGARSLWGLDLKNRTVFMLEEHFMDDGILGCDIMHGYSEDTVITERDVTEFEPGGKQETIIRIYTFDK